MIQNVQTEMCEFVLKMRCLAVWLDDNHDCKAVDVEKIEEIIFKRWVLKLFNILLKSSSFFYFCCLFPASERILVPIWYQCSIEKSCLIRIWLHAGKLKLKSKQFCYLTPFLNILCAFLNNNCRQNRTEQS